MGVSFGLDVAPPLQARDLLQAAGGRLVRVFQESDTRVSYRPYRCVQGWRVFH